MKNDIRQSGQSAYRHTVEEVNVSFADNVILQNFSMEWKTSGVTCLFGRSGCGKTTLLKVIAGLIPCRGERDAGKVSVVFQEDRLLPWFSALDNVCCVEKDSRESALALFDALKLSDAIHLLPSELSGGMRTRVNIARALVYDFSLLIMDEPFKGLDILLKYDIMLLIRKTLRNRPCLFVTHDWHEAVAFADEIVLFDGPPLAIKKRFTVTEQYSERADETFYKRYEKNFIE